MSAANEYRKIDALFDYLERLLYGGQFQRVDEILGKMLPEKMGLDLAIGALCITHHGRDKLPNYEVFRAKLVQYLVNQNEPLDRQARLLQGL